MFSFNIPQNLTQVVSNPLSNINNSYQNIQFFFFQISIILCSIPAHIHFWSSQFMCASIHIILNGSKINSAIA